MSHGEVRYEPAGAPYSCATAILSVTTSPICRIDPVLEARPQVTISSRIRLQLRQLWDPNMTPMVGELEGA